MGILEGKKNLKKSKKTNVKLFIVYLQETSTSQVTRKSLVRDSKGLNLTLIKSRHEDHIK